MKSQLLINAYSLTNKNLAADCQKIAALDAHWDGNRKRRRDKLTDLFSVSKSVLIWRADSVGF